MTGRPSQRTERNTPGFFRFAERAKGRPPRMPPAAKPPLRHSRAARNAELRDYRNRVIPPNVPRPTRCAPGGWARIDPREGRIRSREVPAGMSAKAPMEGDAGRAVGGGRGGLVSMVAPKLVRGTVAAGSLQSRRGIRSAHTHFPHFREPLPHRPHRDHVTRPAPRFAVRPFAPDELAQPDRG